MVKMRLLITLIPLVFSQLFLTMAHASPHAAINAHHPKAESTATGQDEQRRKRKTIKASTTTKKSKPPAKTPSRSATAVKAKAVKKSSRPATASALKKKTGQVKTTKLVTRKGRHATDTVKKETLTSRSAKSPLTLSKAHRARYQKARETAMTKLMGQLGKPYQWGGTSPRTGFDCSGLVWYAYKDLVKFKIPRTANEMYHLRDASPIKRTELEKGDLVFFRINGRGTADHVGVYLGNGKFIQSPRTGKDIQVSMLGEDYWQRHYIGARRVMTPKTMR